MNLNDVRRRANAIDFGEDVDDADVRNLAKLVAYLAEEMAKLKADVDELARQAKKKR